MGIVDGGIVGCGYVCGCSQRLDTGEMKFCDNPKHTARSCGCYNIGGNPVTCTKHTVLYILYTLGIVAVVVLGYIGITSIF